MFSPGIPLMLELNHRDGSIDIIELNHTFNQSQIEWFKSGSALNLIAQQMKKPSAKKKAVNKKPAKKKTTKKKPAKKVKGRPVKKSSRYTR